METFYKPNVFLFLPEGACSQSSLHFDNVRIMPNSGVSSAGTVGEITHALDIIKDDIKFNESWTILIFSKDGGVNFPPTMPYNRALLPIPVFRWSLGQRLDQTWLDLELPEIYRLLRHSKQKPGIVVCYADNLIKIHSLPSSIPEGDVVSFGIWERPEDLSGRGALLCHRDRPSEVSCYLSAPSANLLRSMGIEYAFLGDAGIQLLSHKAVQLLCEYSEQSPEARFDSDFLEALGNNPVKQNEMLSGKLSSSVCILEKAKLYSLKTGRDVIQSVSTLMNLELDETKLGMMGAKRHPDQYLQNSRFSFPLRLEENHTLWVENSVIPKMWKLSHEHVFTGIPENEWNLKLEEQVCLDFSPVGEDQWCIKFYRIDDDLRQTSGQSSWMGGVEKWLALRHISLDQCSDFIDLKLFPVMPIEEISASFIEWLVSNEPDNDPEFATLWSKCKKFSLNECLRQMNHTRSDSQRNQLRNECLGAMLKNSRWSVFYKADLESTAELYASTSLSLPIKFIDVMDGYEPLQVVHDRMFRSAVMRYRKETDWEDMESEAFKTLSKMLVQDAQIERVDPKQSIIEDQVVWGRCPVRFDLAGGWSDTPPYCLERGGRVVNLAVDLNGQPPIQVFAKLCDRPELVVRSIDQGVEKRITTYEELSTYAQPGDSFALAKAALAQAGFLPAFSKVTYPSLQKQLESFGGGVELSLLSAVPKGSGLGTSSILAATVLATLGEACGLNWDKNVLFTRTLALEQMLTTGGGWQDQAGGIFRGVKMVETGSGLKQTPTLRWLPDHLFEEDYANKLILLYYTGITRMAKNILHEIVRGIFLNSPQHLKIIEEIADNAQMAFNAIQMADYSALIASIKESWRLNQLLDKGTNPVGVQEILKKIENYLEAAKLLGAGGGGYLLLFAKDRDAAAHIRKILTENPPNKRARFVQFSLSQYGLQLTRS